MISRLCLYVDVEGNTVAETIARACATIADEKRWSIRVTGVTCPPRPATHEDPTQLIAQYLDVAKQQLRQLKEEDGWKAEREDEEP